MSLNPAALVPESEPEHEPETSHARVKRAWIETPRQSQPLNAYFGQRQHPDPFRHGHGLGHGLDPERVARLGMKNPRKLE